MRALSLAWCLMFFLCTPALAQTQPAGAGPTDPEQRGSGLPPISINVRSAFGAGQGAFKDNAPRLTGITVEGHVRVRESPLRFGAAWTYLRYATERQRSLGTSEYFTNLPVLVTTSNYLTALHGVVRVQPAKGRVRPYVDGLVGFSFVFTDTTINDAQNGCYGNTACKRARNNEDYGFSVGGGAGVTIDLKSWPGGETHSPGSVDLDIGLRYPYGGEVEHLTNTILDPNSVAAEFTSRRSRTDVLAMQAGFAIQF